LPHVETLCLGHCRLRICGERFGANSQTQAKTELLAA